MTNKTRVELETVQPVSAGYHLETSVLSGGAASVIRNWNIADAAVPGPAGTDHISPGRCRLRSVMCGGYGANTQRAGASFDL